VIVVTGADGQLGTAFRGAISGDATFLTRKDLDLTASDQIARTITGLRPSAVINCAAHTNVDGAETDEETANAVNGYAVGELAGVCRSIGARFLTFSTDYVFDGTKDGGYVESDVPSPVNAYGRSKLLGERLAREANPDSLIVRTSWLLSGTHPNFIRTMIRLLAEGDVSVVNDQFGHPTLVDDLAPAALEALDLDLVGILHLANQGVTSWYGLTLEIATITGTDTSRVRPVPTADYPTPAVRPTNSILDSERVGPSGLTPLPEYHDSFTRVVRACLLR
jgi:dTDP-4-dehydrorhamnose reductase